MKSPAEQKIIQIDITNACPHKCSNCTRFCGHHTKSFMMDEPVFQEAVHSLEDFPGMVGIMGGEPTIHPKFDGFVNFYADRIGGERYLDRALEPIVDFSEYRTENLASVYVKRGLWTSLGAGYYRHFELIQEVFGYQCINDHTNPGLHQALLITRKELGIPDDEWIKLRDACWIQNLWSSCITPKGAFFCEVAGALDMLFNGPGGWKVEKNWWQRTPEEFGEQLQWCELCSAALQVPRRQANWEVDDISPDIAKKLEALNSPKLRRGDVQVFDPNQYDRKTYQTEPNAEWYLPENDNAQRISATNRSIFPQHITALVVLQDSTDLEHLKDIGTFDQQIIICSQNDETAVLKSGLKYITTETFDAAAIIDLARHNFDIKDWILLLDSTIELNERFVPQLREWVLNPGCIYYQEEVLHHVIAAPRQHAARHETHDQDTFILFNINAQALRNANKSIPLRDRWPEHKQINLGNWYHRYTGIDAKDLEAKMLARHMVSLWSALTPCYQQIALYGGGLHTKWLTALLKEENLPFPTVIIDDAAEEGQTLNNIPIKPLSGVTKPDAVMLSLNNRNLSQHLTDRVKAKWQNVPVIDPYAFFPKRNV